MFRFENLEIWKLAINYAKECYILANKFPQKEQFSLADQLRRAAISVSNNIAEGSAFSNLKFKNFLDISIGSALETVNIILFSIEVGYIDRKKEGALYEEAEKLIRKIRSFKSYLN
jgi:four helix bundle protein